MSVSLVVLRLEVADGNKHPESFNYQAPHFTSDCKPDQRYMEQKGAANSQREASSATLEQHRGQRVAREFTIETYVKDKCDLTKSEGITNTMSNRQQKDSYSSVVSKPNLVSSKDDTLSSSRHHSEHDEVASDALDSRSTPDEKALCNKTTAVETRVFRPISQRRFSPVDSPDESSPPPTPADGVSGGTRLKSHSPVLRTPPAIHFFSGNPMVEVTKGILHLYKNDKMTSLSEDVPRSEMVCILTAPSAYTIHDLLQFVTPVSGGIECMKIIRDTTPNNYMVLLKFQTQKQADDFYTTYNNVPFNSIEAYVCHLVYVAKLETMKSSEGAGLPVPGLTEMPNCPVCLERMDESVDGILTILCNHSFHMTCLSQWGDTSCPVCRYCQTPPEDVSDNKCLQCGSQESLWICLICGHVGCGRYVAQHAWRHFQETQHCYAMQLGHNKVWDYVGDNYVHRLVQNKGDGKLVEVDERGNLVHDEKMDSLTLEYTYLLTSQLESQRLYFEEKMNQIEADANKQIEDYGVKCKAAFGRSSAMEQKLNDIVREKQSIEKKCTQLHTRLTKVLTELSDEKEMNNSLLENQQVWQKRVNSLETNVKSTTERKDKEVTELQEQLRDVMFYLEAQQKLSNTTVVTQEEIQEGQVIVGAAASPGGSGSGKKSRSKKR